MGLKRKREARVKRSKKNNVSPTGGKEESNAGKQMTATTLTARQKGQERGKGKGLKETRPSC